MRKPYQGGMRGTYQGGERNLLEGGNDGGLSGGDEKTLSRCGVGAHYQEDIRGLSWGGKTVSLA